MQNEMIKEESQFEGKTNYLLMAKGNIKTITFEKIFTLKLKNFIFLLSKLF